MKTYKEILLNSVVLPVEKDWESLNTNLIMHITKESDIFSLNKKLYPNGVIIEKE